MAKEQKQSLLRPSVCVCVCVEMHLCVNLVLPEGGSPLILAQVEGSGVGAEEGSDEQRQRRELR